MSVSGLAAGVAAVRSGEGGVRDGPIACWSDALSVTYTLPLREFPPSPHTAPVPKGLRSRTGD